MPAEPMPLARACSAVCCFQASKPPGPLPHWAASAFVQAIMRGNAKLAIASFLPLVIGMFLSHAKLRGKPHWPRVVSDGMAQCGPSLGFGLLDANFRYNNTLTCVFSFHN